VRKAHLICDGLVDPAEVLSIPGGPQDRRDVGLVGASFLTGSSPSGSRGPGASS